MTIMTRQKLWTYEATQLTRSLKMPTSFWTKIGNSDYSDWIGKYPREIFESLTTHKDFLRSSTCPLAGFFWLLSHVIYLKLTRVL